MADYKLCFDSPSFYNRKNDFYSCGSSPRILKKLIEYLDNNRDRIESIYIALYLFNNKVLHEYFKQLASQGIEIRIVSIPLEGYDDTKPKNIIDLDKRVVTNYNETKYSLAKKIYDDFNRSLDNYNLFIFPHIYIRSSRLNPFSRGNLPYSLHTKSILIKFKDGTGVVGLTSSNLAVRDLVKEELMILVENDLNSVREAEIFFNDLINKSFNVVNFEPSVDWFHYYIQKRDRNDYYIGNYYLTPFYDNSPQEIERALCYLISIAQKRIYMCAQHICAYDYFVDLRFDSTATNNRSIKKQGILGALLNKAQEGIDIKCLSQTYVDAEGYPLSGGRAPENRNSFSNFIKAYNLHKNCMYAVNSNVHSKFIIIDNIAVVTTCNFTPTQFIYLDNVVINSFEKIPNASYSGIHAEVGQYVLSKNSNLTKHLVKYFNYLWNNLETVRVK